MPPFSVITKPSWRRSPANPSSELPISLACRARSPIQTMLSAGAGLENRVGGLLTPGRQSRSLPQDQEMRGRQRRLGERSSHDCRHGSTSLPVGAEAGAASRSYRPKLLAGSDVKSAVDADHDRGPGSGSAGPQGVYRRSRVSRGAAVAWRGGERGTAPAAPSRGWRRGRGSRGVPTLGGRRPSLRQDPAPHAGGAAGDDHPPPGPCDRSARRGGERPSALAPEEA